MDIAVAGGVESISMNQNERTFNTRDPWLVGNKPSLYMMMLETAEIVSARYGISRDAQDAYSLQSQMRTAAAQSAGLFKEEIVALGVPAATDGDGATSGTQAETMIAGDEGNRPGTTLEGLSGLKPVFRDGQAIAAGRYITAGNASQLSDGASALVLMSGIQAERRGLEPLGIYRGMAVAGVEPDEMGIGPVAAVPKLLRAKERYAVVTMCIGGGMAAAGLFEVC